MFGLFRRRPPQWGGTSHRPTPSPSAERPMSPPSPLILPKALPTPRPSGSANAIVQSRILDEILAERRRQIAKYGERQPHWQMLPILIEEVGEVGTACKRTAKSGDLRTELVQVGAVVLQWIELLDADAGAVETDDAC